MSQENQPEEKPIKYWPLILVIVLLVCSPLIAFWTNYYVNHVLAWNGHEQILAFCSGGAVFHAIALLVWMRADEHESKDPDSEYRRKRHYLFVSNILDHLGWALLLLAVTFSEARADWHIAREIYFAMAALGSALSISYYVLRYKHASEPSKTLEQKTYSASLIMFSWIPIYIAWKYVSGAASLI